MDDFHPMGLGHPASLCLGMLSGPKWVLNLYMGRQEMLGRGGITAQK